MSERTNIWGGTFEINFFEEDQDTENDVYYNRSAYQSPSEEEVKQGWLLRPATMESSMESKRMRKKNRCMKIDPKALIRTLVVLAILAGVVALVAFLVIRSRHHRPLPAQDNYTIVLHQALMFFNAQRCMFLRFSSLKHKLIVVIRQYSKIR